MYMSMYNILIVHECCVKSHYGHPFVVLLSTVSVQVQQELKETGLRRVAVSTGLLFALELSSPHLVNMCVTYCTGGGGGIHRTCTCTPCVHLLQATVTVIILCYDIPSISVTMRAGVFSPLKGTFNGMLIKRE